MSSPFEPLNEQYVIFDDGSAGVMRYDGDTPPPLPSPGRVVSEAEYLVVRDVILAVVAEAVATQEAVQRAAAESAYDALVSVGIPDAVARRLSGHQADTGVEMQNA